jgi:CobQ-like glutamine amidotransferase family enzyme
MAGIARSLHNALGYPVLKTAWGPAEVAMAGIAGRRSGYMRRRFSGSLTAWTMAGSTITRRTSEQALSVTGFAAHSGVSAIKEKTRGAVVKGQARRRRGFSQGQTGNNRGQHKKNR